MSDVQWLDDEEQCLWRRWIRSHGRVHHAIARDLRGQSAMSEADFAVLVNLTDQPSGGLRMSALAELMQWDRSRISHQVSRMERRGLVQRRECEDDGRGAVVEITKQGRGAIGAAAPSHVVTVRKEFFDRLTRAEQRDLSRLLGKLVDAPPEIS